MDIFPFFVGEASAGRCEVRTEDGPDSSRLNLVWVKLRVLGGASSHHPQWPSKPIELLVCKREPWRWWNRCIVGALLVCTHPRSMWFVDCLFHLKNVSRISKVRVRQSYIPHKTCLCVTNYIENSILYITCGVNCTSVASQSYLYWEIQTTQGRNLSPMQINSIDVKMNQHSFAITWCVENGPL